MSFSRKAFISVLLASLFVSGSLIWIGYDLVAREVEKNYRERYLASSRTLARTLTELERTAEVVMRNAARVVVLEDARQGLLSPEVLLKLRDQVEVTHLFIADSRGRFIRSTNEAPDKIPNLYSFCQSYEDLVRGTADVMGTPIIPPWPEPKPFKFLTVPSHDRRRLIEVGMRVDFIGNMLKGAVQGDPNVQTLAIYAPDGSPLGSIGHHGIDYPQAKARLPDRFETVSSDGESLRTYVQVESTQPSCCQCDVAGISKGGRYYYVIESVISKAELVQAKANLLQLFIGLGIMSTLLALLLARWFAGILSKRLQTAAERVREIRDSKSLTERIGMTGKDEISLLTNEFDAVLGQLLDAQKQVATGELAGQVAHNIQSPIHAIESVLPGLGDLSSGPLKVVRNAVREINDMVRGLEAQARGEGSVRRIDRRAPAEWLPDLAEAVVSEVRARFHGWGADIDLELDPSVYGLFSHVEATEFKAVIANLVKNGLEAARASSREPKSVVVMLNEEAGQAVLEVRDTGDGIAPEIVARIGEKNVTFGKKGGQGLGLYHARKCIEGWGGEIRYLSSPGRGTTVRVLLPLAQPPTWFLPEIKIPAGGIVVLDDEPWIGQLWKTRLSNERVRMPIREFRTGTELTTWLQKGGKQERVVFLIDYDLQLSGENGLEVIDELGIAKESVLVTGHFGEAGMMTKAAELGIRVLPKSLAQWVPIRRGAEPGLRIEMDHNGGKLDRERSEVCQ